LFDSFQFNFTAKDIENKTLEFTKLKIVKTLQLIQKRDSFNNENDRYLTKYENLIYRIEGERIIFEPFFKVKPNSNKTSQMYLVIEQTYINKNCLTCEIQTLDTIYIKLFNRILWEGNLTILQKEEQKRIVKKKEYGKCQRKNVIYFKFFLILIKRDLIVFAHKLTTMKNKKNGIFIITTETTTAAHPFSSITNIIGR
jgi:hypothetical protein